ncbi:MAG TPA: FliM/FliN family flagellar motor switch protein [Phycisphaerae bacterium]|nr:FliM/FliN family flagellar motor switch protein [Phycisphaerae bacterium]
MSQDTDSIRLLHKLVAAAAGTGKPIGTDIECTDYDWNVPCHYSRTQLPRLAELGKAMAEGIARVLGGHLGRDIQLTADAPEQRFGCRLAEQLRSAADYRLVLRSEDTPCGVLSIRPLNIVTWVDCLLGGQPRDDVEIELSELEADLLADAVGVLVKAVSDASTQAGGRAIGPAGNVARRAVDLPGEPNAEWCVFGFRTAGESDVPGISLALGCDVLDEIVLGRRAGKQAADPSIDARAALTEHFARVPLRAAAMAGEVELTVREVMDLEPGDVVLLPKGMEYAVELHVDGQPVLSGCAVAAVGCYGVEIVGACGESGKDAGRISPAKGKS